MDLTKFLPRGAYVVSAIVCVSMVAVLAGAISMLARDRTAVLAAATTSQSNMALGLERDILRNIDIYDLSLRAAASGLQFLQGTTDRRLQNAILFDGSTAAEHFRPIVIFDPAGNLVLDGRPGEPRVVNVAGRPVFEAHRANADLGLLVMLARPGTPPGAQTHLSLSRRIKAPDGGFGGIVAGGLGLSYLTDIFSHFTLPQGGAITLVTGDGQWVAGFPSPRDNDMPPFAGGWLLAEAARTDGAGHDAGGQVASVRQLGHLPYFLVVSTPRATIYADWNRRALAISAGLLGFHVFAAVLVVMLWSELSRRRMAERGAMAAIVVARAGAARLATYVDQLADGLLAIRRHADGHFVYEHVNEAAADMLGIQPQDAIGRAARDIWPGPVGTFAEDRWRECLEADATQQYEQVLDLPGGRRTLRFVLAPVRELPADAAIGKALAEVGSLPVTLLLASLRDVSATIALEEKLRQTQRMEAVGQLTAGVAHDFNNMLQAQLGALELLTEEVADRPHALELATLAFSTGQHGARLTHSLLSFSRQQHLAPQAVPVAAMLDGLQRMLARTLGPLVTIQVAASDPAVTAFADMAQLEAALVNLALNARDAMPSGGQIAIVAREWREADGWELWPDAPAGTPYAATPYAAPVLLTVSDTGSGMSPAIIARACEPFFTTKGVGKGSGLGLSMVQGFVQQSGGTMRIRSVPGQGTLIELCLPAGPAGACEGQAELPKPAAQSGRILLVDDTPDVLGITAELLEAAGFTVVQAPSGAQALNILASQPRFDVLVTDYTMPGMDGGSLVRAARTLCAGLPALIVTGQADIEGLRDLPPRVDVVRKPLSGRALAQHVSDVLEGARPEVQRVLAGVS